MAFGILGVGSACPDQILTNHDLEKMVDTNDEWIRSRTGIVERRISDEQTSTCDLAALAGERALKHAGVHSDDIDLIVMGTFTPDYFLPSGATTVMAKMHIPDCAAFDVNAACTGFVYALAVAHGLLKNGLARRALVIGADCITKYINFKDRSTCVLFGDGAGAVVLGEVEEGTGILAEHLSADGRMGDRIFLPGLGTRNPATPELLEAGDQYIHMNGNDVFKFAVRIMSHSLHLVAERAGVDLADLDWIIPHQANQRIIDGSIKRMHVPRERFIVNVDRYGNTSAASVPLALDEAVRDGRIKRGDMLGLVAFGGGLTWGGTIIKY